MSVLTLLAALPLYAEPSRPSLTPAHKEYAFSQPRILVQQRLFGLAHGIRLLAAACATDPRHRQGSQSAYKDWHEKQAATIESSYLDLARHYYGDRAAEADWPAVARALNLKQELDPVPDSKQLDDACATLAEALARPRYNLLDLYLLQSMAARLGNAARVEAEVASCKALSSPGQDTALADAYVLWAQVYSAGVEEAKNMLMLRWDDSQLEGSYDDWVTQASASGTRAASARYCSELPQWLLSPEADPDAEFNRIH
jgi:hypothetical protein